MTTANPDTTAKPAPGAPPPASGSPSLAPGADSAAEPTLKDRAAELRQVARQEQAKLRARETERAERVALETRLKAAEEKASRLDALEKELDADGLGVIKKRQGVKYRDLAERVVKEGTPDARIEELEQKLRDQEERDARRQKELEDQLAAKQQREAYESARKRLHETFDSMKEKLPLLARLCTTEARTEREYMAAWNAIQSDPEARGLNWTDAEIFEAMEQAKAGDRDAYLEGSDADVLESVLTKKRTSATVSEKASPGGARQGSESASSSSARTLTNGQAASKVSADDDELAHRKGESLEAWSKRQDKILAERLRQSRRG